MDISGTDGPSVHLWVAPEKIARASAGRDACRRLLSEEELRRESLKHRAGDRALHRLGRALTRTVLSTYVDVDPSEWVFARGRYGRPRIAAPTGVGLEFNLAHTAGLALLLVGSSATIGVDVEAERRPVAPELPREVFGDREREDLESRHGRDRRRRFFEYWTLKEAYAKALGTGLSLPLDQCVFQIEPSGIDVLSQPGAGRGGEWWFSLPSVAPGYVTAVAVARDDPRGPPPRLSTFVLDSLPAPVRASSGAADDVGGCHPRLDVGHE